MQFCFQKQVLAVCNISSARLVMTRCLLTRLQLVQVPSAYRQRPLILVHALAEIVDVRLADLGSGVVIGVGVGVVVVWVLRGVLVCGCGFCGLRGTAAEESADGVADGRAYCYATVGGSKSAITSTYLSGIGV